MKPEGRNEGAGWSCWTWAFLVIALINLMFTQYYMLSWIRCRAYHEGYRDALIGRDHRQF